MKLNQKNPLEQKSCAAIIQSSFALLKVEDIMKYTGIKGNIKESYKDPRRTEIVIDDSSNLLDEDLIHDDSVIVLLTRDGYIKRMKADTYKTQGRGGKGVIGIGVSKRDDDEIQDIFVTSNHQTILFFSNSGKVFSMKIYKIPEAERRSKGTPISYLLPLVHEDFIITALTIKDFDTEKSLIMVTKKGTIKKVSLKEFKNIRKTGIIALKLRKDDSLNKVRLVEKKDNIVIVTKKGLAVRFDSDIREIGRSSFGVRGIRLSSDDSVIGMEKEEKDHYLLCITENGYGKITRFDLYRKTKRGTKGVRAIRADKKTGFVSVCRSLTKEMSLIISTSNGNVIQINSKQIPQLSRNSKGVRLIRVEKKDKVIAVARAFIDE